MKNLLLVTDTWFPKKDGVVKFLNEIIPELIKDFHISVLAPNFESQEKIVYKKGRFNLIKLPVSKIKLVGYPMVSLKKENRKIIRKEVMKTDLVFVQNAPVLGLLALKYSRKFGKPVFNYLHHLSWEDLSLVLPLPKILGWLRPLLESIFQRFFIRIYNRFDLLILPYKRLVNQFSSLGIITKMVVVRLGVDCRHFFPRKNKERAKEEIGLKKNFKVIGYVGRLSREKNVRLLIEVFQEIRKRTPHSFLLIVGSGPEEEKFKNIQNCLITGFVPEVRKYLQAMDVFVMPSSSETTSLATLEAMSSGLPVIATKTGYLEEYIKNNINGMLFPKNNSLVLKIKLMKLLTNKKLRAELGKEGRRTIVTKFSWLETCRRLRKILLGLENQVI